MRKLIKVVVVTMMLIIMPGCQGKSGNEDVQKAFEEKGYIVEYYYYNSFSLVNEELNIQIDVAFNEDEVENIVYSDTKANGYVYYGNNKKDPKKDTLEVFTTTLKEVDTDVDGFIEYASWYYQQCKEVAIDYDTINQSIEDIYTLVLLSEEEMKLITNDKATEIAITLDDNQTIISMEYGDYNSLSKDRTIYGQYLNGEIDQESRDEFKNAIVDIDMMQFSKFMQEYYTKHVETLSKERVYSCTYTSTVDGISVGEKLDFYAKGQKVYKKVTTLSFPNSGISLASFTSGMQEFVDFYTREGMTTEIVQNGENFDIVITMDYETMTIEDMFKEDVFYKEYIYQLEMFDKREAETCTLN